MAVAIGLKDIKCVSEVSLSLSRPLFPFAAEYARGF